MVDQLANPNRPTGQGDAILVCNGPSAEGYNPPDSAYSVCLNAGFLAHTKASGAHVDAAYSVDCPFSIQKEWGAFPGWHVQAEHVMNLRACEEPDKCLELVSKYASSTFCALDWLRKKGYRKATIVGMDALWGQGHDGLVQKLHIQGCLAFAKLFPDGLYVRDLGGREHQVTDAYLASIPVGAAVKTHGDPATPVDAKPAALPLFIGYYTVDTPYEDEAKLLRLSLEAHGLPYFLHPIPSLGSWQKNTQYKAKFIREMQVKFADRPLVYVDVDAIVVQRPEALLNMRRDVDIAAVHLPTPAIGAGDFLSGTVYFGDTDPSRALVRRWVEINEKYPDVLPDGREAWDQRTLEMALSTVPGTRFQELPPEYTFISGICEAMIPDAKPIILHTRGAYRFKTQINAAGAPKVYRHKPWVVWPTCQPEVAARQVAKWRDLSYHVGLLTESEADIPGADFILRQEKWRGFPAAANMLCAEAVKRGAHVVCVAGDDIDPDPQTPGPEILDRYHKHFPEDYGVMQPTGDKFGAFDSCCISPWIGRQFIERTYGGHGPYFEGYNHCFCDKELQEVAKRLERFWQVPNLCQRHNHWTRTRIEAPHHERIKQTIGVDEALYRARWGKNFPGYLVSK